jgi:hypothetical protein
MGTDLDQRWEETDRIVIIPDVLNVLKIHLATW